MITRHGSGNGIRIEKHTPDGNARPISKPSSSPTTSAKGVGTRFKCDQNTPSSMVEEIDGVLQVANLE